MKDQSEILKKITAVPLKQGRRIIAVAGAPASGKSTLAEDLAKRIENTRVVPMDGFHRDNDDLERHGLLARKGAPETFDVSGFIKVIRSLRTCAEVVFPTFDRTNDCVVPASGRVTASDQTILVEGNYLLLDFVPWDELADEWDYSVMIDVPIAVLQERLVQRWLDNGHDELSALARAKQNDLPNAELIISKSRPARLTITTL